MEVLLRQASEMAGKAIHVESVGTSPAIPAKREGAAPEAIAQMHAWGMDLSLHRARHIDEVNLTSFDHILAVNTETRDALVAAGASPQKIIVVCEVQGGVPNPWQKGAHAYYECAKLLRGCLDGFVAGHDYSKPE